MPFLLETPHGKDIVSKLDVHYKNAKPDNINNGDDVLKLVINLVIRFIKMGKSDEIIAVLKNKEMIISKMIRQQC